LDKLQIVFVTLPRKKCPKFADTNDAIFFTVCILIQTSVTKPNHLEYCNLENYLCCFICVEFTVKKISLAAKVIFRTSATFQDIQVQILVEPPKLPDYINDLTNLLSSSGTHIYIDTSFLTWLTRIGSQSRSQFLEWLRQFGLDRIHVPLWVSHEFQLHHNDSSLKKILLEAATRLTNTAQDVYSDIHPILDEVFALSYAPAGQNVANTRVLFSELHNLGKHIEKWNEKSYSKSAADVIELINQVCIDSGSAFEYLESIGQLCDNRYTGRVPPGFEDRGKKDTDASGGNRAGDLIVWKEILEHTRANQIQAIVVLTNDGKKDWIRGGLSKQAGDPGPSLRELRKKWPTLPIIHPMLEHEACVSGKVKRAALANNWALGTYFHTQNIAPAFVTAAVRTELQFLEDIDDYRPKGASAASSVKNALVAGVTDISPMEMLAIAYNAADPVKDQANQIVADMIDPVKAAKTVDSWILPNGNALSWKVLFWITRLLVVKSAQHDSIASQRVTDILSLLPHLDEPIACALYGGTLFGVYLQEDNNPVSIPQAPFLQAMFQWQDCNFSAKAIDALHDAIGKRTGRAIYLPEKQPTRIKVRINTTPQPNTKNFLLNAFVINDTDYFIDVNEGDAFALPQLLSIPGEVKANELITGLCTFLGLPLVQLEIDKKITRTISLRTTDGLNAQLIDGGL